MFNISRIAENKYWGSQSSHISIWPHFFIWPSSESPTSKHPSEPRVTWPLLLLYDNSSTDFIHLLFYQMGYLRGVVSTYFSGGKWIFNCLNVDVLEVSVQLTCLVENGYSIVWMLIYLRCRFNIFIWWKMDIQLSESWCTWGVVSTYLFGGKWIFNCLNVDVLEVSFQHTYLVENGYSIVWMLMYF